MRINLHVEPIIFFNYSKSLEPGKGSECSYQRLYFSMSMFNWKIFDICNYWDTTGNLKNGIITPTVIRLFNDSLIKVMKPKKPRC